MEYLLKASALVVVFYLCYKVFLQRDTFFQHNRSFLLLGLITAFLLPFIVIPIYIEYTPVEILPNYNYSDIPMVTQETEAPFNILDYLPMVYLVGVLCFLVRFSIQVVSLSLIIYGNKKEKHGRYTHVKINKNLSPFSFFNWIVYNPKNFSDAELEQIITHEKVHANQKHSIDILLTQLSCIILWFNPFIWLYNNLIKQNLEFIADKETQRKFNCNKSYQTTLLKTSMPSHQMALTNNFYTSLIKKRILMLHKSKSKKINLIKYAFVIPLLAIFLMSFNTEEVYVEKESPELLKTSNLVAENKKDTFLIYNTFNENQIIDFKKELKSKGYDFQLKSIQRKTNNLITAIDFIIIKNGVDGRYRVASGIPLNTIVIEYFNTENKFVINTLDFIEPQKKTNQTDDIIKIIIDKNTTTKSIELQKKIIKEKHDVDINFEVIDRYDNGKIKTYTFEIKNGKSSQKIKTQSDRPHVITYDTKTNLLTRYIINKNGDPEYGNKSFLADRKNILIESHYNDKSFEKFSKSLKENGIIAKFSNIKRNEKNEITAIKISAKAKDGNTANYNQSSEEPISQISISYYGEGQGVTIGPSTFPTNKLPTKNKKGNKSVSKDSITKNKTRDTTVTNNPWKVTVGVNAEKNSPGVNITSIDGKNPIYIIDGKEITKKELQEINPIDIALVSVLKDEKATTAYGDKGENGVVLITTKKNTDSKWKVTGKRNKNVIFATKDTIYIKEKQHLLKQLMNSFNQQPLYILDGKEVDAKNITAFDEMKVGRLSHIKNSEVAVSKYGKKAKNGVVEITSRTENSKTPIVKVVGSATYIVDGKKISSDEFDNLQPENIKTFKVLKGNSTKYGTNTNGSIIEITTKKK
jgi:TonB-dependent SusC/RagA subfamily outer membrane receptor